MVYEQYENNKDFINFPKNASLNKIVINTSELKVNEIVMYILNTVLSNR
jgi:hypothetical protein